MKFRLRALENARLFTDPDRPWVLAEEHLGWIAASPLREVAAFEVEAESAVAAADEAFALGNDPSNPPDLLGRRWDHSAYRSMSSGDVVEVETPDGPVRYACLSFGWAPLPPAAVPA